jgi:homopolymeric O-antigen transport system ATP-binding protein
MSTAMIRAEGLGKKYRIGQFQRYGALRDSLAAAAAAPAKLVSSAVRRNGTSDAASRREPFWALRDVSFEVDQGEIVGLIGQNGAGKSTLLKVLSRITEPTAGSATLHGRVGSLLEVGTGFHAELTGRENIFLNGAILGMRRAEIRRKFDEIVEFAGIGKFLDTPIKRYSSGMEVRLGFSVAAHLETEILLVDEVLAVGDVEFQRKCLGKIKDVTSEGRTVLFVSHNLTAVRGLCPRTILLRGGRLEADGSTDAVLGMYLAESIGGDSAVVEGEELDRRASTTLSPEHSHPLVQVRRIALLDDQGMPRRTFASDEQLEIALDFEVNEPVTGLGMAFQIVNDEMATIVQTLAEDTDQSGLSHRTERGLYRGRCRIPPNMFGERRLYVCVGIWAGDAQQTLFDSILDFEVSFQGYNDHYSAWKGDSYIRPRLAWVFEPIVAASDE